MYHVVLRDGQSGKAVLMAGTARDALTIVAGYRLATGSPLVVRTDDGVELSDDELHLRAARELSVASD